MWAKAHFVSDHTPTFCPNMLKIASIFQVGVDGDGFNPDVGKNINRRS